MRREKTIPWRLRLTRQQIKTLQQLAKRDGRKETDYTRLVIEDHLRMFKDQPSYSTLRDRLTIAKPNGI